MTLKELLEIAKKQLRPLTNVQNPDFRLEQAEYFKKEGVWEIVVSYLVENINKKMSGLEQFTIGFQYHRIYKKAKIRDDGEFLGFFMYNNVE